MAWNERNGIMKTNNNVAKPTTKRNGNDNEKWKVMK